MNYLKEFPDFDFDVPHIEGFEDTSWHNNVSPSFARKLNDTYSVTLWVDYLDPDRRECGGCQFLVCVHETEEYETTDVILETDSLADALEAIKNLLSEASR